MRGPAVLLRPEELYRPSRLCCLLALVLMLPFFWGFAFVFPQGQDFEHMSRAMCFLDLPGGLYEMGRQWLYAGGRYGLHFLQTFLGRAPESLLLNGAICLLSLASYGLAVYGLARLAAPAIPHRLGLFCGLLTMLGLCACHPQAQQFYNLTQSLSLVLPGGLWLCFLLTICRLWLADPFARTRRSRQAMLVAFLTVGLGEMSAHAALALALGTWLLAALHRHPVRRELLRVVLVTAVCTLIVFISPGRWATQAAHPLPEVWEDFQRDWWRGLAGLRFPLWAVPILALALLLPHAQGEGRIGGQPLAPDIPPLRPGWLTVLALTGFVLVSLSMTALHAAGDAFSLADEGLSSVLAIYGAATLILALYPWLGRWNLRLLQHGGRLALLLTAALLALCLTPNWRQAAEHAAAGDWVISGDNIQDRYNWLWDLGRAYTPLDAPMRLGLLGQHNYPGSPRLTVDPHLPQVAVRALSETAAPVLSGESLRLSPQHWPNPWVAWFFGLGSVRMAYAHWQEEWTEPLRQFSRGEITAARAGSPLILRVPDALRQRGLDNAWLAASPADPNATFSQAWLVLDSAAPLPTEVAFSLEVWRLNPVDARRMLPIPTQIVLARELLAQEPQDRATQELWLRLAASRMPLVRALLDGDSGRTVYAVPLGMMPQHMDRLPGIILSLDGQTYALPGDATALTYP
ncbi:hypothetical protein [uncultured Desulfovibrio sp.]|uniref:hypothetical protein n=1 Tax=uncultured Desulfovibrio sp. TaxID=167968 RepID=UPI00262FF9BD|nr:hypothetical protein [uncultured Desulfovibrio sp.]